MESKFKKTQIDELLDNSGSNSSKIIKVDDGNSHQIKTFEISKISSKSRNYNTNKSLYGALATTDEDRKPKTRKDERFIINPASRELLAVDDEEQRAIDERVRVSIEALKVQAHSEGFYRGYSEGLEKARLEVKTEFSTENQERSQKFSDLITSFEGFKTEIFRANERYLVELICRISKMIILKELSVDQEYLLRLARHLIERVGVKDNIRIKINPTDFETAAQLKEGLEKVLGELKNIKIESSSQVERGGCQLETDWNLIDAGLDTQLKSMHEYLVGGDR